MSSNSFSPEGRRRGRPTNAERAARDEAKEAQGEDAPRESRAEQTRRERRRRDDTGEGAALKLTVPEHLKKPGHTYRWTNDTAGGRTQRRYNEDWEFVKDPAIESNGEGTPVTRVVDEKTGQRAYLMEKPIDLYNEDRQRREKPRKELEQTMLRGPAPNQGLNPSESYVPQGHTNRIGRA